jgi:putative ABC transport system permease protein
MTDEPLWRRVLRLRGPDPRADVRDEFAFHIAERVEALMARGMTEAEAREAALRQFGDLERAAEACTAIGRGRVRERRRREWWASVMRDVGYAVRTMRQWPGFTLATVGTLALGIGANTVVFSLLNALLFQPLDAVRPRELVRVYTSEGHAPRSDRDRFGGSSYADYVDLRGSRALADLAAFTPLGATAEVDGMVSRVEARVVSDSYFAVLGRPPFIGTWMAHGGPDGQRAVVVSHRFWTRALGADPSAIGRSFTLNGHLAVVAGVTSPAYRGIEPSDVDLYVSFEAARDLIGRPGLLSDRGERSVWLIGRLAPGVTPSSAEQSLGGIMQALAADHPATNASRTISVRAARSIVPLELLGPVVIPTAGLVFAATLVMLGIAGVNVAAVLLARTIRRRRELAIRVALGGSRLRLVRQLATENLVLGLAAGAAVTGLLLLLPRVTAAVGVPSAVQPAINLRVLGYAVAVAVAAGGIFGLAPAIIGMRTQVLDSLRDGATALPTRARAQRALVTAQIALSMLLLVVGAALLASLDRQQRVDPGFEIDGLVVAQFEDPTGTPDRARGRAFTELAAARLNAIPGVRSVTVGSMAPFTSDGVRSTIHIPGYVERPAENMDVPALTTGPNYFRTLGIPLLRGRERVLEDRDTMPRVVVNQSMARLYWRDANPVGRQVRLGGPNGRAAEVIGVVADARFRSLAEPPQPMYAVQTDAGGGSSVMVRTAGDPAALLLAVRGAMSRNDVPFTLVGLRTMREVVRSSLAAPRAVSGTLMAMGILAITLAAVGLYGVVSYVTAGRTPEFGVRLALGATSSSILRLVLGYGMRLALVGGTVGLALGLGALRVIEGMLFGSWTYAPLGAVVGMVLGAVTLAACVIPAIRASGVSPSTALRTP